MEPTISRLLVDKERVFIDGNLWFKLYLWEEETGMIKQVLAPVNSKVIKIIRDGVFDNAL